MDAYDVIVVGAGSAGAAVAGRLSEDPDTRVLLVEAGADRKPMNVAIPAAFATQFKTAQDWEVYTAPEPHLDGRVIYHPRGKQVGGSSAMNAMIYMRGNRADYDGWSKGGAKGWSYDEVLPLFRRSENNSRGEDAFHGASGPMHVQDLRSPTPMVADLIEAFVETGLPRNDDFNGASQVGVGFNQVTQRRGTRWTTRDAFVRPAVKRRNFRLMSDAHVLRVVLEKGRAVGIEVELGGSPTVIRAEREVILSAGAFNSPQLLMLSGIGPADHLVEHGIQVVHDNPNVGDHLMDHPLYLANFETSSTGTLAGAESPRQLVRYLAARRGMLTSNVAEGSAFYSTGAGTVPDIQVFLGAAYFRDDGFAKHESPAYVFGMSLIGSQSRGAVRLQSADPKASVRPTFNYFAEQADMDAMVTGIERAREAANTARLRPLTMGEIHPGRAVATREDLVAEVRRSVQHTYHPACTARIGSETEGVVDHELRVHGIDGLRVADASVFPTITSGNTHAPAVMVGEMAADLVGRTR